MKLELSLNDSVSINLTLQGAVILNSKLEALGVKKKYKQGQELKMPVWRLMEIIGPIIDRGNHQIIEDNKITVIT